MFPETPVITITGAVIDGIPESFSLNPTPMAVVMDFGKRVTYSV